LPQCSICQHPRKNLADLSQHVFLAHNDTLPVACDHCSIRFFDHAQREEHVLARHTVSLPAYESIATSIGLSYWGPSRATRIIDDETSTTLDDDDNNQRRTATIEPRIYSSSTFVKRAGAFACQSKGCTFTSVNFRSVCNHHRRAHSDLYIHYCRHCAIGFVSVKRLCLHKRSQTHRNRKRALE